MAQNKALRHAGPSPIIHITNATNDNVNSLKVDITPVQSGSGDPSPTNVRPISGWTGTNVVVSSTTDAQDGTTYPISWQSEAGTVYGGTLDVTTGLLTVERVMNEFDGSSDEGWYKFGASSASAFAMFVPREHFHESSNEHIKANYLKTISQPVTWGAYDNWISANTPSGFVTGIKSITDVDSWKAYLSQNPLQVCYKLATPQTYQLTPTQIALQVGTNNVWADCGNVLKIRYWSSELLMNKVVYSGNTLIDLTGDTITSNVLLSGYIAHDATGSEIEGSLEIATLAEVKAYLGIS